MQPSPPPTIAVVPPQPASFGRSLSIWGGLAGGLLVLLSLMGKSVLGIAAGLVLAIAAVVIGARMDQQAEEQRHRRALELLLHTPDVLITQVGADRDLDMERLRGMMKKQHIELTESRAIRADLVRLSQSLTALQLAAWEKSEKDPSFRALYDQISGAVQTAQQGADDLLGDLTGGTGQLDADAQRKFEALNEMLLSVLDRWINRR